jgi:hypothetical protein
MAVANTLAYYDVATITAIKGFIVDALGLFLVVEGLKHYLLTLD